MTRYRFPKKYRKRLGEHSYYGARPSRHRPWHRVEHEPNWAPTQLRYNREGNTKPGFHCVHQLENGNGICDSTVFQIDEGFGTHSCIVSINPPHRCHRVKRKVKWSKL